MKDGVVLVSHDYISMITQLANEKFVRNREKSDEFYRLLQKEILKPIRYPPRIEDGSASKVSLSPRSEKEDVENDDSKILWALLCDGSVCEEFRSLTLLEGHLDRSRRNVKLPDGRIAIPITAGGVAAVRKGSGGLGAAVQGGRAELSAQEQALPAGRGVGLSPHVSLRAALKQLLEEEGLAQHGDEAAWEGVPRHWEEYGDLVLLPEGSLGGRPWQDVPAGRLWERVARGLGVKRVALKAEVDAGPMRQSRVALVHAPGADGWVQVRTCVRAHVRSSTSVHARGCKGTDGGRVCVPGDVCAVGHPVGATPCRRCIYALWTLRRAVHRDSAATAACARQHVRRLGS